MTINLVDGVTVGVVNPLPTPVTPTVLGSRGAQGAPGLGCPSWSMGPGLVVTTDAYAWRFPQDATVASVAAVLATAPASTAVVVDVTIDGTSLWLDPADRPTIPVGDTQVVTVPDVTDAMEGDLLAVHVTQVDATARRLTVIVHLTAPSGS
jgi:hypothetical protein